MSTKGSSVDYISIKSCVQRFVLFNPCSTLSFHGPGSQTMKLSFVLHPTLLNRENTLILYLDAMYSVVNWKFMTKTLGSDLQSTAVLICSPFLCPDFSPPALQHSGYSHVILASLLNFVLAAWGLEGQLACLMFKLNVFLLHRPYMIVLQEAYPQPLGPTT